MTATQTWEGDDRRQSGTTAYEGTERRQRRYAAAEDIREDVLHHDPLLDCLVQLTRIHGRPSTHAALTAGLPLSKGLLTPSLFVRAHPRRKTALKA